MKKNIWISLFTIFLILFVLSLVFLLISSNDINNIYIENHKYVLSYLQNNCHWEDRPNKEFIHTWDDWATYVLDNMSLSQRYAPNLVGFSHIWYYYIEIGVIVSAIVALIALLFLRNKIR